MEHKVKSYKRRTKSGKMVTVKAHSRRGKLNHGERAAEYYRKRGNLRGARGAELEGKLERKASDKRYDKMTYREAVKAGAPKLSPNYGETSATFNGKMKYGQLRKKGYVANKNIRRKAKEKL